MDVKKRTALVWVSVGLILVSVGVLLILFWMDAPLQQGSYIVKANSILELSWYLQKGDRTEGGFTVSGGNGNASLSVRNPSGEIILHWYAQGSYFCGFTAQDTGVYTMIFRNLDPISDQSIHVGFRSPYEPRLTVYDGVGLVIVAIGSGIILLSFVRSEMPKLSFVHVG